MNISKKLREFLMVQIILAGAVCLIIFTFWFICSFVSLEFNPANWAIEQRKGVIFLPVVMYLFSVFLAYREYFTD